MDRLVPALVALALAACVAPDRGRDDETPTGCTPGATAACACTDGRSGAQACGDDGTFGACTCEGGLDGGRADAGPRDGGSTDGGSRDAGPVDAGPVGTPCEQMCAHVYDDCGKSFQTTGGAAVPEARCVELCDEGTFTRAQRTCFTTSACTDTAINACFAVRPVCPRDAFCGARTCGLEPECQTSCGTCGPDERCSAIQICEEAHGWVTEVANPGQGEALAFDIDPQGGAHVAFLDGSGKVFVGTRGANGWPLETVETVGVARYAVEQFIALKAGAGGLLHVAYRDSTSGALRYARREGGSWTFEKVQDAAGDYVKMALDPSGTPHLAYAAGSNGNLTHARRNADGAWEVSIVDGGYGSGYFAALAVASDGVPHVASNDGYRNLLHARFDGAAWVKTIVETGGSPAFVSLALDAQDVPHVVWHSRDRSALRAAHGTTTGFDVETVASAGNGNAWTSLAAAPDGTLHLSFMVTGADDLAYARRAQGRWEGATVDASGIAGLNNAIALTPTGEPWIVYETTRPNELTMLARHLP